MNTGPSYFEIQADDTKRAIQFYEEIFGWEFEREENLPIEYYRITTRSGPGALLKRPADKPPQNAGTNAYLCSMQTDDFDQLSEKILVQGGKVAMPKFAVPGKCWQGYFLDTEGNVFGLFEIDENAK